MEQATIKIDINRKYVQMGSNDCSCVLKKICYIISQLPSEKKYCIILCFGNLLTDNLNNKDTYNIFKKLISILIYLVQTDSIYNVFMCVDCINNKNMINILNLIKFSGIMNRFELFSNKNKIKDINVLESYILDKKFEFVCCKNIGETK